MTKTANLYARIEPELKTEAEGILASLGVPVSNAINIFYRQIVLHKGLPFEVRMPQSGRRNAALYTQDELDRELELGLKDIASGNCRPFEEVRNDLCSEFGL